MKAIPGLTVNEYGKGKAWYVAADADKEFYGDFLEKVLKDSGVSAESKKRFQTHWRLQ